MPRISVILPHTNEPVTLSYRWDGEYFSVELPDDGLCAGRVVLTGPGEGWLFLDSLPADHRTATETDSQSLKNARTVPFYMIREQETLTIWLAGQTYMLRLPSADSRRKGKAGEGGLLDGEVQSPMPGTILSVRVQPGDRVAANQPLIILESMKMEMTLASPAPAVVESVRCAEGQLVEKGAVLVTLKPDTAEEAAV